MTVCFCCRGNVTKVVNIVVISEDTLYCPLVITRTNKGTFHWPKTVSGVTVELQCDTGRKDICLHLCYFGELVWLWFVRAKLFRRKVWTGRSTISGDLLVRDVLCYQVIFLSKKQRICYHDVLMCEGNHVRITRLTDEIEKFSLSRKIDRTKFGPKHLCQLPKRVFHYRVKKKVFSVQNVIGVFCWTKDTFAHREAELIGYIISITVLFKKSALFSLYVCVCVTINAKSLIFYVKDDIPVNAMNVSRTHSLLECQRTQF